MNVAEALAQSAEHQYRLCLFGLLDEEHCDGSFEVT
jgi:hypothetical protein